MFQLTVPGPISIVSPLLNARVGAGFDASELDWCSLQSVLSSWPGLPAALCDIGELVDNLNLQSLVNTLFAMAFSPSSKYGRGSFAVCVKLFTFSMLMKIERKILYLYLNQIISIHGPSMSLILDAMRLNIASFPN